MLSELWKAGMRKHLTEGEITKSHISFLLSVALDQSNPRWGPSWTETAEFILEELGIPGENLKEKLVFFQLLGEND